MYVIQRSIVYYLSLLNRRTSALIDEDCMHRGRQHQEMTPSHCQTLNLPDDDRRRMFTTGQRSMSGHCVAPDGWTHAEPPLHNSLKLVGVSQREYGHDKQFNDQPNGLSVSERYMTLERTSSSGYYVYETLFDGVSDRQRVTAV